MHQRYAVYKTYYVRTYRFAPHHTILYRYVEFIIGNVIKVKISQAFVFVLALMKYLYGATSKFWHDDIRHRPTSIYHAVYADRF